METKTKIFIAAGVLLLIGGAAAIYFYIRKKQSDAEAEKERLNAELNAVQLEALNQAAKDEAEAAALAALFPTEPIVGGTQINSQGNANNAMSGGTGNAVAADSTAGKQLIALQKAIMSQNAAVVQQAKNRANINADMIFSGVQQIRKDKFAQAMQIRTGWDGQNTTFPIPTQAKDTKDFTKMMAWADFFKPNPQSPLQTNWEKWLLSATAGRVFNSSRQDGKIFDLPDMNYSIFTPDGFLMPNAPLISGAPPAVKLMFGDGKPDTPLSNRLYFAQKPNNKTPVDLRTLSRAEIEGITYPILQGAVQWQQQEQGPTNTSTSPSAPGFIFNGTGDYATAEKIIKNWSSATLLLDQSLENMAKEILLQQNRIFFAN